MAKFVPQEELSLTDQVRIRREKLAAQLTIKHIHTALIIISHASD